MQHSRGICHRCDRRGPGRIGAHRGSWEAVNIVKGEGKAQLQQVARKRGKGARENDPVWLFVVADFVTESIMFAISRVLFADHPACLNC